MIALLLSPLTGKERGGNSPARLGSSDSIVAYRGLRRGCIPPPARPAWLSADCPEAEVNPVAADERHEGGRGRRRGVPLTDRERPANPAEIRGTGPSTSAPGGTATGCKPTGLISCPRHGASSSPWRGRKRSSAIPRRKLGPGGEGTSGRRWSVVPVRLPPHGASILWSSSANGGRVTMELHVRPCRVWSVARPGFNSRNITSWIAAPTAAS